MEYRIYTIRHKTTDTIRLVRAGSYAQVLRHIVKDNFEIDRATTADVADYIEAGIPVERVANNDLEN